MQISPLTPVSPDLTSHHLLPSYNLQHRRQQAETGSATIVRGVWVCVS